MRPIAAAENRASDSKQRQGIYHGERLNSVTHVALLGNRRRITRFAIFGAMRVILVTASTLYHSLRPPRSTGLGRQ